MDDLIAKVGRAHADAEGRIDDESQWLAFSEFVLPKEDADLKTVGIARVGEIGIDEGRPRRRRRLTRSMPREPMPCDAASSSRATSPPCATSSPA